MLLTLAKMIACLDTHELAPMLLLFLALNVYGKLLTAGTEFPAAHSTAAGGSCMQTLPQTAAQSTCHYKWLNQCICTTGIQHRRYSWAAPEPAGQGARSS